MKLRLRQNTNGFSIIEILMVVAVIGVLGAIVVLSYSKVRQHTTLQGATQDLLSHLEEVRSSALSGKDGLSHGIKFSTSSYTIFAGDPFDPDDTSNINHSLNPALELSTTLESPEEVLIFSRITGAVDQTATVTISQKDNPSEKQEIVIGSYGDISEVTYE